MPAATLEIIQSLDRIAPAPARTPHLTTGGVVNASAYRAAMLTSASRVFDSEEYWEIAERNLWFVLESQNDDGSWPYAKDGVRNFVDHFHTCFVMKALAKIHRLTGHAETLAALEPRGQILPCEPVRRRRAAPPVCRGARG